MSTALTGERVLADGQKLQHAAKADIDVQRSNKLRARMFSARRGPRPAARRYPSSSEDEPACVCPAPGGGQGEDEDDVGLFCLRARGKPRTGHPAQRGLQRRERRAAECRRADSGRSDEFATLVEIRLRGVRLRRDVGGHLRCFGIHDLVSSFVFRLSLTAATLSGCRSANMSTAAPFRLKRIKNARTRRGVMLDVACYYRRAMSERRGRDQQIGTIMPQPG